MDHFGEKPNAFPNTCPIFPLICLAETHQAVTNDELPTTE